eukprot:CAMPEP_0180415776 /NCGR_PEP_ID=MMETSP1036_2-20121128/111_1 /TAXON_ID=632150 /ORGANISM="Azadinium spinosum, Strain 3D9" /LENGTH=69 /DNA_ID=CAMNT_0022420623 /DNA_START=370 /DNA_END=579 /DNA_ORIENTATION=-
MAPTSTPVPPLPDNVPSLLSMPATVLVMMTSGGFVSVTIPESAPQRKTSRKIGSPAASYGSTSFSLKYS